MVVKYKTALPMEKQFNFESSFKLLIPVMNTFINWLSNGTGFI